MVDIDSIKRAAEIVNLSLYSKGYFSDKNATEKLLFKSIDDITTTEQTNENDKIVLNVLYSLIQEGEKSVNDKQLLQLQINDKKEIIGHFETSNKELNQKNDSLRRENNMLKNEVDMLKLQLKRLNGDKVVSERNLNKEKYLINSLKTKHDKEMKKKNIMINQLQDKLINRKKKYDNVILGNNFSHSNNNDSFENKSLIIDDEMEKMMVDLSNLITRLTLQNDKSKKFINFLTNYLTILNEFYIKKISQQDSLNLPPTPRFYHDNLNIDNNVSKDIEFQQQEINKSQSNISVKISQMVDFEKLETTIFKTLDKFYGLLTNEESSSLVNSTRIKNQEDHDKIILLQKEIETLKRNLESALETNDKWSKKFNQSK